MKLADLKDLAAVIQSLITVAAIIVGGTWTYFLFIRKRQRYPRAKLEYRIAHWNIDKTAILVSIDILISNTSDILLSLVLGNIYIHQVLPVEEQFSKKLSQIQPLASKRIEDIDWPLLFSYQENWEKQTIQIEPGESEQIHYTLLMSSEMQMIHLSSFFRNAAKRRRLEWGLDTFYNLRLDSSTKNT